MPDISISQDDTQVPNSPSTGNDLKISQPSHEKIESELKDEEVSYYLLKHYDIRIEDKSIDLKIFRFLPQFDKIVIESSTKL